jgi:hypothetical protein
MSSNEWAGRRDLGAGGNAAQIGGAPKRTAHRTNGRARAIARPVDKRTLLDKLASGCRQAAKLRPTSRNLFP